MRHISLKFDIETLKTTKKTFIFTVASLMLDSLVKSRLNLGTDGTDGVLRDAHRISVPVGEKLISTKLSGFVDRGCTQEMSPKFKALFKIFTPCKKTDHESCARDRIIERPVASHQLYK